MFEGASDEIKNIVSPLIDDVVFLENTLQSLRMLPFIRVKEGNTSIQKATPASKQYKELLQQYGGCIKILCGLLGNTGESSDSPLREGLAMLRKKYDSN